VRQAVENIQTQLRANGLYYATVSPTTSVEPSIQQINIDFAIDPGKRAKFDGVVIEGDPAALPMRFSGPHGGAGRLACLVGAP